MVLYFTSSSICLDMEFSLNDVTYDRFVAFARRKRVSELQKGKRLKLQVRHKKANFFYSFNQTTHLKDLHMIFGDNLPSKLDSKNT